MHHVVPWHSDTVPCWLADCWLAARLLRAQSWERHATLKEIERRMVHLEQRTS
jgi:hypothetical protein